MLSTHDFLFESKSSQNGKIKTRSNKPLSTREKVGTIILPVAAGYGLYKAGKFGFNVGGSAIDTVIHNSLEKEKADLSRRMEAGEDVDAAIDDFNRRAGEHNHNWSYFHRDY